MLGGSTSNLILWFRCGHLLSFSSFFFRHPACVCLWKNQGGISTFCFYVCRPAHFPASLSVFAHIHASRVACKYDTRMQTHTFIQGRHVSSWKRIQMSTKEGPWLTLSASRPAGCNLSQCSHKRQLICTICMKWELFLGNRGLSFDVSCRLLAWEWKPQLSREREREKERRGRDGGWKGGRQYSTPCSVSLVSVASATQQQAAWSWSLRDSVRNPLLLFN